MAFYPCNNNYSKELPIELVDLVLTSETTSHILVAPHDGYYLMTRGSGAHTGYGTWGITDFIYRITGTYSGDASGGELYCFYATTGQTIYSSDAGNNYRYAPSWLLYKLKTNRSPIITRLATTNGDLKVTITPTNNNALYSILYAGEYVYLDGNTYPCTIYRTDNHIAKSLRNDMHIHHQTHSLVNFIDRDVEYGVMIRNNCSRGDTTICSIQF